MGAVHTVLVADDSGDIRDLIRIILEGRGYRVAEAADGRQAVEVAARVNPDLILMDLSMPVLDGYEATRRIKADGGLGKTPVVAISAFCDPHNVEKALDAGCDDCLGKPVDFVKLDRLLKKHLLLH